ncbi:hypothetical protein DY000_02061607 [Brassica cretica]|uniref:Uncharacterized protein n=1 Tax=Brassica cretica TaxID=69181 RepID=A0ABQ7B0G8_BRACR|nr:hypothetical protein DY000_02061607 [Brassica cretica]
MITRSNKGIRLLVVEPLDLERVIHKSKRAVDTLQATIDSVKIQASIDTIHPSSIDTIHLMSIDSIDTIPLVSENTIRPGTVHREKIEVFILKVDENEMLRNEEGRTRNSAGQLINTQGAVIPDVIVVAEMNEFDLSREWYDWVGQYPFHGLPHQDPRNHIEELEDLVSRSEQNEVSEYHMLCKIFPYSIYGDAFNWFLASLDEEYMIPIHLLDEIMAKRDEQHGFGEPSKAKEAETSYPTSTLNDTSTSTSIDGTTSTSSDDKTSTSIDITTSSSIHSGRVLEQKEFDVCEILRDGDTTTRSDKSGEKKGRNWKKRKRIKDGPQVKQKIRGRRVRTRIDDDCAASIDRASLASIDLHLTVSIDRASRVLIAT